MSALLPVLNFHDIVADRPRRSGDYPAALFGRCLQWLERRGYRSVDLVTAMDTLRAGQSLPARSFAITFDDGYASAHRVALPLLERHGFTATVFVLAGDNEHVGGVAGRSMLSWREVRELHAAGWGVGSHGCSHRNLCEMDTPTLKHELVASRTNIENVTGATVSGIAWPFGRHDQRVRNAASAVYRYGFADKRALTEATGDPFALARIDMAYFARRALVPLLATPLLGAWLALPRPWATRSAAP